METEVVQTPQTQPEKKNEKKKRIFLLIFSILILISLSTFLALTFYTRDPGVFISKVSVTGIDLSGMTQEEALNRIQETLQTDLTKELELQIPEKPQHLKFQLKDLGLSYPVNEALEQAWKMGREGNLFVKAADKWKARRGYDIPLPPHWDDSILEKTLSESLQVFNRSPQNATFQVTPDNQMLIVPETLGRKVNINALVSQIKQLDIHQENLSLNVPSDETLPEVTAKDLEPLKITGLLAEYSTQFDTGLVNRTENIRLAAKAIDGKLLAPGESFSFNGTVGERTAQAGYKEAMIIVGDVFTPGLGGGICQVSSTLYNAVARAQLGILERHRHSLPVTYVPPGQDATVAWPDLDFKFKNTTNAYILIRSSVKGNTLTFRIYGKTK